jgi:hypothetical protein
MELLDALVSKIATAISVLYWEMKYVYSNFKMNNTPAYHIGRSKYGGWEINTHGHRPALEHMTSTVTINDAQTFELSMGISIKFMLIY